MRSGHDRVEVVVDRRTPFRIGNLPHQPDFVSGFKAVGIDLRFHLHFMFGDFHRRHMTDHRTPAFSRQRPSGRKRQAARQDGAQGERAAEGTRRKETVFLSKRPPLDLTASS
jgi:hypothetical protein